MTCQKEMQIIWETQENWITREKLANVSKGYIFGLCVPDHMGNPANEEAESLAKAGALKAQSALLENNPSFAVVKNHVLARRKQL